MKLLNKMIATTALTVAALSATSANAATLFASYTPTTDTAAAFSFNVDSMPTTGAGEGSFSAAITNAMGQYAGRSSVIFFALSGGGGLGSYYGPQLYTGTGAAREITTGTFTLFNDGAANRAGTLTISNVAAVPEPATWGMMLVGVGMMGFALRRRNKNVSTTVRFA